MDLAFSAAPVLDCRRSTRFRVLRRARWLRFSPTQTHMRLLLPLILFLSFSAHAAMVRVVSIDGARSITIERDGVRERIELGGVEILDTARATDLLRWTIGTSWVLIEKQPDGRHFVYRSPDAMFINRELVLRGYARATSFGIEPQTNVIVTYLGQIDPPLSDRPSRGSRSDTRRRSSASPARRTPESRRSAGSSTAQSPGPERARSVPEGGTRARRPRR